MQEYPKEVAGLVFIECQPPTHYALLVQRFGQEKADDPGGVKEFRSELTIGWDYAAQKEKIDFLASPKQAVAVTSLGDIPTVVLVAGNELVWHAEWKKIVADSWLESQTALSQLSKNSQIAIVPNARHITIARSSAVDQAVQEVYQLSRRPGNFD